MINFHVVEFSERRFEEAMFLLTLSVDKIEIQNSEVAINYKDLKPRCSFGK